MNSKMAQRAVLRLAGRSDFCENCASPCLGESYIEATLTRIADAKSIDRLSGKQFRAMRGPALREFAERHGFSPIEVRWAIVLADLLWRMAGVAKTTKAVSRSKNERSLH